MKVKICGITSLKDAKMVVDAGADAIGLNFYPKSSRFISPQTAREIALGVGAFTVVTGLFVDASREEVEVILEQVPLHLLQFHGDESPEFCASFNRPYLKAIRMRSDINLDEIFAAYSSASAILLDAYKPGVPGGTGEAFDWSRVPQNPPLPVVLAGGLTPDNVLDAVRATQVYAVDVSGGVELAPGLKDPVKVSDFIYNSRLPLGN